MAAYIRKVRTASGATAVQIAAKQGRRDKVLEHLGSAHTDSELAALLATAREKLLAGQQELDLDLGAGTGGASTITGKRSRWLIAVIDTAWRRLGFGVVDNEAFFQLVAARIVEPTSVADAGRVLREIGIASAHRNTFVRTLRRCTAHGYRDDIAQRCFEHAAAAGDLNLLLYDVTTLYFEAEKEDDLRKVGYSKERRVDPQIVVGLLVDRNGFPLEIGCFEGNHAETRTIVPIVRQFQARHNLEGVEMVIAADAGMLSSTNLKDLDAAGLKFIVGSRVMKAPSDLASHFHWNGDVFTDGQVIDTVTPLHAKSVVNDLTRRAEPVWDPSEKSAWRAIWAYSKKRAVRDNQTLNAQEARAQAVIDGTHAARSPRFVKTTAQGKTLDTAGIARARSLVGLKGYVTNLPVSLMNPHDVMEKYHDLWQVEQSFRMSKTDLRARPIFSHTRDSIETHLTIVFAALAISRYLQDATGMSIRKIVRTLRPLQEVTVAIAGHEHAALDPLTDDAVSILDSLEIPNPRIPGQDWHTKLVQLRTDEIVLQNGRQNGRRQEFQSGAAIYWSPLSLGIVGGAVRDKYNALGAETGPLGYPSTDEIWTTKYNGRYNNFLNGTITWSGQTGARVLYRETRDRWTQFGREDGEMGYPLQDEQVAPDGVGHFAHFEDGSAIYSYPVIGAWRVPVQIMRAWSAEGYEAGGLGYPINNASVGSDPGIGLVQGFEYGAVAITSEEIALIAVHEK